MAFLSGVVFLRIRNTSLQLERLKVEQMKEEITAQKEDHANNELKRANENKHIKFD